MLVFYANANLLQALHRLMTHICVSHPRARALVDSGFLITDYFVGYIMLFIVGILSFVGVVSKIQSTLLFNTSFARSVRRGKLVRTVGMQKAEPEKDKLYSGTSSSGNGSGDREVAKNRRPHLQPVSQQGRVSADGLLKRRM